jgi:spermidine synthase
LSDPTAEPRLNQTAGIVLVVAIFLLAICGLVYELIAGTLSSYLLGDSVTQFSLVIGIFLTAMGVGSYFSQHIRGNLLTWLVGVELAVGVIGGSTALIGFATFSYTDIYEPVCWC